MFDLCGMFYIKKSCKSAKQCSKSRATKITKVKLTLNIFSKYVETTYKKQTKNTFFNRIFYIPTVNFSNSTHFAHFF